MPSPAMAVSHRMPVQLRTLLEECRKCATDSSQGSLVEALKSLHSELIRIRTSCSSSSSFTQESSMVQRNNRLVHYLEGNEQIENPATNAELYDYTENECLRNVAEELMDLERAILHIDDEVDGDFSPDDYSFDDDYGWYSEMLQKISHATKYSFEDDRTDDISKRSKCHDPSPDSSCSNHERWIDRCLDVCGYAISLEVAVDCLRQIVHRSSIASKDKATATTSSFKENLLWNKSETKCPGFAAAITSLRTIRRRLLLIPASGTEGGFSFISFPRPLQHALSRLDYILDCQRFCSLSECLILPLEYHFNRQSRYTHQDHQQLSDSLSSLVMSVLPTLISSACYAKHLCLPTWAKSSISLDILFQSAWKSVLVGNLYSTEISAVASNYFQLLVRQIIESGRSNMIARQLHKCWTSFDTDPVPTDIEKYQTPRSIFCRQIESIIGSTASKREIAMFAQSILRHCVKHKLPKYDLDCHLSKGARKKLYETCKTDILPFLRDMLLPSIAKDAELAEAVVHFMILSPPASYHAKPSHLIQAYPKLKAIDQAVPWCLVQLLASNCDKGKGIVGKSESHDISVPLEDSGDDESDDGTVLGISCANILLSNLFAVALVWCEQVFVTRTDTLQQQYVTEFLIHPLEWKQITQDDLQQGLSDNGTTLAAVLVQGVSLRLDVSRSESIRADGMRVAEALASLLGQSLRFDELHQSDDTDNEVIVDKLSMKEMKRKNKARTKKGRPKRRGLVVVDPDALILDDEDNDDDDDGGDSQSESSTSSHNGDNSSDSVSSWGEDSLQPYDMDDDEEDLRRVPRPHNLRECVAYLISSENDDLAYDRHQSALTELVPIIVAQPLDLHDVLSILLRILLHLEDKFSMDEFSAKRWDCLLTLGLHAPYETCVHLVGEMKESFPVRMEALFLVRSLAQELSSVDPRQELHLNSSNNDQEICRCSTRLQRALGIREPGGAAHTEQLSQSLKTRRWRKLRAHSAATPNRFGPISVQMTYCIFAFLSQTRTDEVIWGGSTGERFLSEFLRTLSIMLHCARTYTSSALRVLAADLFELAWSFRDAICADVRHAALMAVLTCVSILPIEIVMQYAHGMSSFLTQCSANDDNADCRYLASLVAGSMSDRISQNLIGHA